MKATEAKLLDFLRKSPQFVIPIYQRTYSWTEKECQQLREDIVSTGVHDQVAVHFIGSIIYIEAGLSQVTHQAPLLVIDGQQRLTTVTLLIAALAEAVGDTEPVDGFSPRKLRNYYLLNPEETGERRYKVLLSQTDRASLTAIVGKTEQPSEPSLRVTQNFILFKKLIASRNGDFGAVCKGLAKLVIVDIALTRGQDNPQLIFESVNSTGLTLSKADLVRNFILMGLEPELQTALYSDFWHPMELAFGQEAYGTHFDSFMRYYLTVKTGEAPRIADVYEVFKAHANSPEAAQTGPEALVKDIRDYAGYYCNMALGTEPATDLKLAFQDLRELKVDVAYPLLLELYHDYAKALLTERDFVVAVRLIESYVFRRAICGIPTNSMNKTFPAITKALRKERHLESIQAQLLLLPSYRRFPGDEEFARELRTHDLYNFRSRGYWLRRLENHGRKERVPVDEYTIEHIMPQNEDLPAAWKGSLGPDWERVRETWLHTIGNLTLTGYNSEFSDRSFQEKRDMEGGFKMSPLRLNAGLGQLDQWNEDAIKRRSDRLAQLALETWAAPKLPPATLETYGSRAAAPVGYSINDHPRLTGALSEVFQALRKEVLALDPCVVEQFLKFIVAYKAETHFVDVEPQAKRLLLTLNLPFAEINDPKGMCRDVTGLGHQGNGDVSVGFSAVKELPYIMGLVRQSFERQMSNGGDI